MRALTFSTIALVAAASVLVASAGPKKKTPPKKTPPKKEEPKKEEPKDTATTPTPTAGSGSDSRTAPGTNPGGGGGGSGSSANTGGGSGDAGSAAAPVTTTTPAEEPAKTGPDVDSLRQEYLTLRDELFKSRARANAVASQLYSTRIAIKLTYTSGRFYNPAKSSIRLDGASVYDNASGAIANDDGVRFEGYVAPGRHVITFRVEATGKDDDTFTSTTEAQIVVKAVASKDLVVNAKARDSGDIAYAWKKGESGSYGLAIDVGVKTAAPAVKK